MRWLDRLEKHFGAWAIPQFPLFIVVANAAIFFLSQAQPAFVYRLLLNPEAVQAGEYWRLITFLFVPPPMSFFWLAFWLYFIFQCAQALEAQWGEFKFCFFYLLGALATGITSVWILHQPLGNGPLNTTLLLAFATLYPEVEMLLFFILPVKVKYMGWLMWLWIAWSFLMGSLSDRVGIAASLMNYVLFFGPDIWNALQLKIEVYRNRRRFPG